MSPVREKGDKVFGGALSATTGCFITDDPGADGYFPDDDMEDTDPKSSASAPATVTYVSLPFLLEVLLQFLVLVFALDMLDSISYLQPAILSALDMLSYGSYMNMLFIFSLSNCMACFITATLVMLYLVFLLIKSLGKLLIFPTVCVCANIMLPR